MTATIACSGAAAASRSGCGNSKRASLPSTRDTAHLHVCEYVGGDPDVFVLSNLDNVGSVEINAFQSHAAVIIQKSIREGFGLTVTEGLWKARPTVGGAVGGIPLQIEDGVTAIWCTPAPNAPRAASTFSATLRRPPRWRASARSTCVATTSCPVCCATT